MISAIRAVFYPKGYLWLLMFITIVTGCTHGSVQIKEVPIKIERIVLLGMRPAMPPGTKPGVTRSPFMQSVFMSEPVSQNIAEKMTQSLYEKIMDMTRSYRVIGPNEPDRLIANIAPSHQDLKDMGTIKITGKSFNAEAVLVGYIYRWKEREGSDFSVKQAASVAFDLYLIGTGEEDVLWWGKYDKTQKSLSENVLDLDTFIKSKGKWLTAIGLAEIGLSGLLNKSPLNR